jgi:hypothetical protein
MSKRPLSDQALRQKKIITYLLSQDEYRTPREISKATDVDRKYITRSLSDIRLDVKYETKSLPKPFRVSLKSMAKLDELWQIALFRNKRPCTK